MTLSCAREWNAKPLVTSCRKSSPGCASGQGSCQGWDLVWANARCHVWQKIIWAILRGWKRMDQERSKWIKSERTPVSDLQAWFWDLPELYLTIPGPSWMPFITGLGAVTQASFFLQKYKPSLPRFYDFPEKPNILALMCKFPFFFSFSWIGGVLFILTYNQACRKNCKNSIKSSYTLYSVSLVANILPCLLYYCKFSIFINTLWIKLNKNVNRLWSLNYQLLTFEAQAHFISENLCIGAWT